MDANRISLGYNLYCLCQQVIASWLANTLVSCNDVFRSRNCRHCASQSISGLRLYKMGSRGPGRLKSNKAEKNCCSLKTRGSLVFAETFWQHMFHNLTFMTYLNFFLPVLLRSAGTDCTIYKPAEFSWPEFPGWTADLSFFRAIKYIPAVFLNIFCICFSEEEKVELSLNMSRNWAPALLIGADGFQGGAHQLCQFFLGLVEFFSYLGKLLAIHKIECSKSWMGWDNFFLLYPTWRSWKILLNVAEMDFTKRRLRQSS